MLSRELYIWKHSAIHLLLQRRTRREANGEISTPPQRHFRWWLYLRLPRVQGEGRTGPSHPHLVPTADSPLLCAPQKCRGAKPESHSSGGDLEGPNPVSLHKGCDGAHPPHHEISDRWHILICLCILTQSLGPKCTPRKY